MSLFDPFTIKTRQMLQNIPHFKQILFHSFHVPDLLDMQE